jgi:hypothetical protein
MLQSRSHSRPVQGGRGNDVRTGEEEVKRRQGGLGHGSRFKVILVAASALDLGMVISSVDQGMVDDGDSEAFCVVME